MATRQLYIAARLM